MKNTKRTIKMKVYWGAENRKADCEKGIFTKRVDSCKKRKTRSHYFWALPNRNKNNQDSWIRKQIIDLFISVSHVQLFRQRRFAHVYSRSRGGDRERKNRKRERWPSNKLKRHRRYETFSVVRVRRAGECFKDMFHCSVSLWSYFGQFFLVF